jgi:hypothetical protein
MEPEWLILADWSEIIGDKLYLMGGGWDCIQLSGELPSTRTCSIAASFRVPWDETNQKHAFSIEVLTDEGEPLRPRLQGQVEASRLPGVRPGTTQRAQLSANFDLEFTRVGGYVVEIKMANCVVLRTPFTVVKL